MLFLIQKLDFLPARMRWRAARAAAWQRYRKDSKQGYPRAKRQFEKVHGYPLSLSHPQTHSERLHLRKLCDHDPRFTELTDKVTARNYIDTVLGTGQADELCVPFLAHVDRFADLPASLWELDIILKCTHGSGMNSVVRAGDKAARSRAKKRLNKWLGRVQARKKFEWCYLDLTPSIIAEPLLADGDILDLKLYFYDGILRLVMPEDNTGPVTRLSYYTPDWTRLDMTWPHYEPLEAERPPALDDIIRIATPLAQGFDMIRIDFLLTPTRHYLGELTIYDGSGLFVFDSYEEDKEAAKYWRQPHLGVDT
ncbi:ATP-grasp fold amidoligase family protein [Halovulum sp. GXIMD14793]